MDKVVERWVTTSKPLESRGLWKRFVQERNQVLPQPKPSKSISDKYQDYLKAESYLEPKSQMFVRDEMGFNKGGRIGFSSGTPFPVNDETIEKFRYYIEETNLNKKAIGEKLGFKSTSKGVGGNIRKDSPIVKAYEARYGEIPEERFKPYKLDIKSPQVQKVLELHDEGLSTRQITKRLGFKDEKSVRNIFKQFRPEAIQDPNIKGKITSAKKSKIKAAENIKIAETKAGVKTTKQAKDVKSKILEYNNPYKNMSATELVKDKNFLDRLRMHIDINTGKVTYDGYTKARPRKGKVFSDLELAEHAIKKAKQGQLFTDDHITPKSLQKQNVGYPRNLQPVTYIENSEFDNARKYVLNKPEGDTSAIDKYLTNNKQTLRFPDQKIKLGYKGVIEYSPAKGSHTLVKKALTDILSKNFKCGAADGGTCADPRAYIDDINKQRELALKGDKTAQGKFKRVIRGVKAAKSIATGTGLLVLGEIGFAPIIGLPMYGAGEEGSRIWNDLTYGAFGKSEKEQQIENMGTLGQQTVDLLEKGEALNQAEADADMFMGPEDSMMYPSILEGHKKRFQEALEPFKNPDETFNQEKFGAGFNLMKAGETQINKFKQQKALERRADPFEESWGAADGGIATLNPRRPHAIPPKSGPMPQGGGLSSMFNRVRKW